MIFYKTVDMEVLETEFYLSRKVLTVYYTTFPLPLRKLQPFTITI